MFAHGARCLPWPEAREKAHAIITTGGVVRACVTLWEA